MVLFFKNFKGVIKNKDQEGDQTKAKQVTKEIN